MTCMGMNVKYFSSIQVLHNKVYVMVLLIGKMWQHQFSQAGEATIKTSPPGHYPFKNRIPLIKLYF